MRRWWKAEPVAWNHGTRGAPDTLSTYGPFFLARVSRLSALRACRWLTPLERRMVDHALYSTYWDCVEAGAREQVIDVLYDGGRA